MCTNFDVNSSSHFSFIALTDKHTESQMQLIIFPMMRLLPVSVITNDDARSSPVADGLCYAFYQSKSCQLVHRYNTKSLQLMNDCATLVVIAIAC